MYEIIVRTNKGDRLKYLTTARNMEIASEVAKVYCAVACFEEDANDAKVINIKEVE